MLKQMRDPKQWEIYVHENIGWFVRLVHKPSKGLLTVSPNHSGEKIYSAMISLSTAFACDIRWNDVAQFRHPQAAVDYMVDRARNRLQSEMQIFKAIAGEPGGVLKVIGRKQG